MLPADVGCIVDNVDTVVAVCQAALKGKPLMERIMTVTGDAVKEPRNFLVPLGMLHQEVVNAAGGFRQEPQKVISGGPMMGKAMFSLDVPVIKTSSAILAMAEDEVAKNSPTACINCGRCVKVCPGQILPVRLAEFADHGDEEKFLAYHGMECCECGCCSFVCPAKTPADPVDQFHEKDYACEEKERLRRVNDERYVTCFFFPAHPFKDKDRLDHVYGADRASAGDVYGNLAVWSPGAGADPLLGDYLRGDRVSL